MGNVLLLWPDMGGGGVLDRGGVHRGQRDSLSWGEAFSVEDIRTDGGFFWC